MSCCSHRNKKNSTPIKKRYHPFAIIDNPTKYSEQKAENKRTATIQEMEATE
jgi:hypothetical protein